MPTPFYRGQFFVNRINFSSAEKDSRGFII